MKQHSPRSSGFTLIELMLVITLIAISVGVTSDVLLSLIRSYNKTGVLTEIEQQSNFIGAKLEKELRSASNISVPSSTQLSFAYDGGTVYYNVANGNLYRSTSTWSTSAADALVASPAILQTSGGVNITCDGECFTLEGSSPQIVGISMNLSETGVGGVSFTGQTPIKNTIVIRNSY